MSWLENGHWNESSSCDSSLAENPFGVLWRPDFPGGRGTFLLPSNRTIGMGAPGQETKILSADSDSIAKTRNLGYHPFVMQETA